MVDKIVTLVEIDAYDPSRSNLLAYSRQLQQAASWGASNLTVTADAATGADNQALAETTLENGAAGTRYVQQTANTTGNAAHICSAYVKRTVGTRNFRITIFGANPANLLTGDFDLTAVTATPGSSGTASGVACGMQPLGGGWFRCWVSGTPQSAAGATVQVRLSMVSGTSVSYTGDSASTLAMDRALLELGTTLGEWIETSATAGPGIKTLRYSTGNFTTGATSVPPHVSFLGRIEETPNFTRRLFSDLRVLGGGTAGAGELKLANRDHELASLLDLGMDGRNLRVYVGTRDAVFPSGFTLWLSGTIEQVEVGLEWVTVRLRDRMAILDGPLQTTRYAGTNAGAPLSGKEGVAGDIKDQEKPLLYGRGYHVPAVLVNTGKLIYQIHDGAVSAINAVYDKGGGLTFGANRANLAAMEAAAPAAGSYDTCTSEGLIRLGASAIGKITVDAQGDATGSYIDRVGAILQRMLARMGVAAASIATASFTALDAAANYEVGIFVSGGSTARQAMDALTASVGAWCIPDRTGLWTAGRLIAPASPTITITDASISAIDRIPTRDAGGGIPVWRVNLRYKKNWTPFTEADLVAVGATLTEANRAQYIQVFRTTTASDSAALTLHPLAPELTRETLLTTAADADTERTRVLTLHSVRRDYTRVRVPLTTTFAAIDFTTVIRVQTVALGYDAGRDFVPIAITFEDTYIDLDLWG